MLTKEQELIVKVIKTRNYENIPSWMLCILDDDGFQLLMESILSVIEDKCKFIVDCEEKELNQIQALLMRIKRIGNIQDKTILKSLDQPALKIFELAALLLKTDHEWKRFFQKDNPKSILNYSDVFTTDMLNALMLYYHFHGKIEKYTMKILLHSWNKRYYENKNNLKDISEVCEKFIIMVANLQSHDDGIMCPDGFADMLWESIWEYRHRYLWVSSYFSIEYCWRFGFLYYPYNHGEWIYSYLRNIVDAYEYATIPSGLDSLVLPQNIYPHLESIIQDPYYDDAHKLDMFKWISDIIRHNPNNIIFLRSFRCIFADNVYQQCITKHLFQNKCSRMIFKDYTDFYTIAGERAKNHNIQKDFIKQGGDPYTLMKIEHSVIYTIGGVCCALDNSFTKDIAKLLSDEIIQNLLMDQYLIEGYTPRRTSAILDALSKYPDDEHIKLYYWVWSSLVRLDAIQENTDTTVCRILPLSFQEAYQILKKCPNALENISCGLINLRQMLQIINTKKHYVPLYYGYSFIDGDIIKNKEGIDNYLDNECLMSLVSENHAYLGDIISETTGIIVLQYLCL